MKKLILILIFAVTTANTFTQTPEFNFVPNPVNAILNINSSSNIKTISIFDLLGKKVLEQNTNGTQLDVSGLNVGFYIVKIRTDNNNFNVKIIKE